MGQEAIASVKNYRSKAIKYKQRLKVLKDELEKQQRSEAELAALKQQHAAAIGLHAAAQQEITQLKEQIKGNKAIIAQQNEQMKKEEALQNSYYEALDAQGLICGVCFESVVAEDSLPCCGNKLCTQCEQQVAQRHQQCPFCRAPMTPPQQLEQQQPEQAQPEQLQHWQQQLQQLLRRGAEADDAETPNLLNDLFNMLTQGPPATATAEEYGTDDSEGYFDDDSCGEEYDDELGEGHEDDAAAAAAAAAAAGGMPRDAHPARDTTVLMAAAAEALYASRGPSGSCGLCSGRFLTSALATAEQLPDLLLCRGCWRNIPDLAGQPFPATVGSGHRVQVPVTSFGGSSRTGAAAVAGTEAAAAGEGVQSAGGAAAAGSNAGAAAAAAAAAAAEEAGGGRGSSPRSAQRHTSQAAATAAAAPAAAAAAVESGIADRSSKKRKRKHSDKRGSGGIGGSGKAKDAHAAKRKRSAAGAAAATAAARPVSPCKRAGHKHRAAGSSKHSKGNKKRSGEHSGAGSTQRHALYSS